MTIVINRQKIKKTTKTNDKRHKKLQKAKDRPQNNKKSVDYLRQSTIKNRQLKKVTQYPF